MGRINTANYNENGKNKNIAIVGASKLKLQTLFTVRKTTSLFISL